MFLIVVSAEDEEEGDEDAEKAFLQFYSNVPAGPPLSQVLHDPEKRRKLGKFMKIQSYFCLNTVETDHHFWILSVGKAHLRRAVIRHEEALRVHSLCKILRKMDILQDVLTLTHKRSLDKYSELDREDDFDETAEAPEIDCKYLCRVTSEMGFFGDITVHDIDVLCY